MLSATVSGLRTSQQVRRMGERLWSVGVCDKELFGLREDVLACMWSLQDDVLVHSLQDWYMGAELTVFIGESGHTWVLWWKLLELLFRGWLCLISFINVYQMMTRWCWWMEMCHVMSRTVTLVYRLVPRPMALARRVPSGASASANYATVWNVATMSTPTAQVPTPTISIVTTCLRSVPASGSLCVKYIDSSSSVEECGSVNWLNHSAGLMPM